MDLFSATNLLGRITTRCLNESYSYALFQEKNKKVGQLPSLMRVILKGLTSSFMMSVFMNEYK